METDIGEFTQQQQVPSPLDQDEYVPQYQYPQPYYVHPPPPVEKKGDIFAEFSKTVYIVLFVAFILGFFMGKTMQPVILRPN